MTIEQVRELLRTIDSFAVIEQIQQGSPLEVATRFKTLVSDLYWKAHDLPALTVVGRAGILYCLGQSLASDSEETKEQLRSLAKALAYDLGSFTWPGWEEPGIDPTTADMLLGMDCARLNLRLAIELKKPLDRVSMAHWLIGAHALTAKEWALAREQFKLADDVLPKADPATAALELFNAGNVALANICCDPADDAAIARFDEILTQISAREDENSKSFSGQLVTARRLFT